MPRAERDLADIYDWIDGQSSPAARAWYGGLKAALRSLAKSPGRCPATPENKSLRHLLYGHRPYLYRVIYRIQVQPKQVDVLHIRHGARDEFKPDDIAGQ